MLGFWLVSIAEHKFSSLIDFNTFWNRDFLMLFSYRSRELQSTCLKTHQLSQCSFSMVKYLKWAHNRAKTGFFLDISGMILHVIRLWRIIHYHLKNTLNGWMVFLHSNPMKPRLQLRCRDIETSCLKVARHDTFERRGDDLHMNTKVLFVFCCFLGIA